MRSRPLVRLRVDRVPLEPDSHVVVEVLLTSRSETPTEYVDVVLKGDANVAIPEGRATLTASAPVIPAQAYRWKPGALTKGEHRTEVKFSLPANAPPSFSVGGAWCNVHYAVDVHVAIPFWIDRHAHFPLIVASHGRLPRGETHTLRATHASGPVADALYIEAGTEATELVVGEEIRGEVTFSNVHTRRIRRVVLQLVAYEQARQPTAAVHVVYTSEAVLVSGPPPEGETLPFRLASPRVWPNFDARIFDVRWQLEIRADVVLGKDVTLAIPMAFVRLPPGEDAPPRSRRAPSVGRARLTRVWALVASRVPTMSFDEQEGTMSSARGGVALTIARDARDGTLGTLLQYRFPHLGLDLQLGPRALLDPFVKRSRYTPSNRAAIERFTITGREPAQLEAFFDDDLLAELASAASVELDDDGARVWIPGAASAAMTLEKVAQAGIRLLGRFAVAVNRVPPPAAMAPTLGPWQDFAASVGGRLELGRMWIHDGLHEGFRFEVGTVWEPHAAEPRGTVLRVPIEPPLQNALSLEDPQLSPIARDQLRALQVMEGFHGDEDELALFFTTATTDPMTLVPKLSMLVSLLKALRGHIASGPFR